MPNFWDFQFWKTGFVERLMKSTLTLLIKANRREVQSVTKGGKHILQLIYLTAAVLSRKLQLVVFFLLGNRQFPSYEAHFPSFHVVAPLLNHRKSKIIIVNFYFQLKMIIRQTRMKKNLLNFHCVCVFVLPLLSVPMG